MKYLRVCKKCMRKMRFWGMIVLPFSRKDPELHELARQRVMEAKEECDRAVDLAKKSCPGSGGAVNELF